MSVGTDITARRQAEESIRLTAQFKRTFRRVFGDAAADELPEYVRPENVPADALDFFAEVAGVTKEADRIIKEKADASSPMLKVLIMERALEHASVIQSLQEKLRGRTRIIEDRLKTLSTNWAEPADSSAIDSLKECAAALGFLDRWTAQLQERLR